MRQIRKMEIVNFMSPVLLVIFLHSCASHTGSRKQDALAGLYKLFIMENLDSAGNWHEDKWASGGESYILYDGLGHMSVEITPKGYKDFKWLEEEEAIYQDIVKEKIENMSVEELKAAVVEFSSNYVYVARYIIDDTANIITHKRITSSIPSIWGTEVKRGFSFNGDTLILKVLNGNRRLKWIRQE